MTRDQWDSHVINNKKLRIAIIAGTLGYGGAEKQLIYLARALRNTGFEVRVYCLTRGEPYEAVLRKEGVVPIWFGQFKHPLSRVLKLVDLLREFKPHFLHSTHFYTNLYAALASWFVGGIAIGSLRSDLDYELNANGFWGPWLLRLPHVLLANSHLARQRVIAYGLPSSKVLVLPNVIDLGAYDRQASQPFPYRLPEGRIWVVTVCRLIDAKRLDRFLRILSRAREQMPEIGGVVAGEGPLRQSLEEQAKAMGLSPDGVKFLGHCENVPALLSRMDVFALTSDHEGFPNGILEAMAGALPVIATPAGDAARIVRDGISGFIVSTEDESAFVERLLCLARHPLLRRTMGGIGRQMVAQSYSHVSLGQTVEQLYYQIASALDRSVITSLIKP